MNKVAEIVENMEKVMVGKRETINKIIIALLLNGHVLIEDVPGVGKTQCVGSLAKSVSGSYKRIQFTPDVMASDITGYNMYNQVKGTFEYREGAANCNFLLGDEINRASTKTQSSLLEVMEERQITVDGVTRKVPEPFMVLATQNPIESKGTNKLPEAQLDRFLFRISIGYPTKAAEIEILNRFAGRNPLNDLKPVATAQDVLDMQDEVEKISVSDDIKELVVSISINTREAVETSLGVSPRGTLALLRVSKAIAYMKKRDYVIPEDVVLLAKDVLSHRIILSSNAKAKGITAGEVVSSCVDKALKQMNKVMK